MKKTITLLLLATSLSARAEFGVSAGASFNFKADFRTSTEALGFANDPNDPTDRIYDDGEIHENGSGQTLDYGYDTADGAVVDNDPVDGGTLTLHSSQTLIDSQKASDEQNEAQPAIEIYWQGDITDNEKFNLGLRAALRWQHIDFDSRILSSTTIETINHEYTYSTGTLTFDQKDPGITPGFPVLNDTPAETTTYTTGISIAGTRDIEADIFGLDIGPTLSFNITEKLSLSASVGGTVAWIDSEFIYEDIGVSSGRVKDNDWLFGAYASADLQYKLGEHWGVFGGAAYIRLEDFEQQVDGRTSELQFDDSYTIRAGLFFE